MFAKRKDGIFRSHRYRGMTLVELLVAMGLTGVIAVLLLSAAQTQTNLSGQAQQTQYMQGNVGAALDEIANEVRTAGMTHSKDNGIYNLVACMQAQFPSGKIPPVLVTNFTDRPDQLQLFIEDASTWWYTYDMGDMITNPRVVPPGTPLVKDDFFFVTNNRYTGLYRMAQAPTAFVHNTMPALALQTDFFGATPGGLANRTLESSSLVMRARFVTYRVDNTIMAGGVGAPVPVLVMDEGCPYNTCNNVIRSLGNLVAEGVEDMQIAVGVDGLFDGVQNGTLTEVGAVANDDEWVFNAPGETMPDPLPDTRRITALNITVVVRSNYPEQSVNPGNGRPAVFDRPGGAGDGFRRRILSTKINIRRFATF